MNSKKFILILIVFIIKWDNTRADGLCGDWDAFKDEKCFSVFDNIGVQTYETAKAYCANKSATLVTIHSAEEQDFITKLVFDTHKIVDEVWIGAHRVDKAFLWESDSEPAVAGYTNWADKQPSNLTGEDCVRMLPKGPDRGKWDDESCAQKNVVVCQKMQIWTSAVIQDTLLKERKQLQTILDQIRNHETVITQQKAIIEELEKSVGIPIGFTYVQLPKDKAPHEIWPTFNWTDTSGNYAGVFFRVAGGPAAAFGAVQEDDCPRFTKVSLTADAAGYSDAGADIPKGGFGKIKAGSAPPLWYFQFAVSNTEVRPRNMAIRVWTRTA